MLPVACWIAIKHVWPAAEMTAVEALATIGFRGNTVAALLVPLA